MKAFLADRLALSVSSDYRMLASSFHFKIPDALYFTVAIGFRAGYPAPTGTQQLLDAYVASSWKSPCCEAGIATLNTDDGERFSECEVCHYNHTWISGPTYRPEDATGYFERLGCELFEAEFLTAELRYREAKARALLQERVDGAEGLPEAFRLSLEEQEELATLAASLSGPLLGP